MFFLSEKISQCLPRSIFVGARVLDILNHQISNYKDDIITPNIKVNLNSDDVESIIYAKELVAKNMRNLPIIAMLVSSLLQLKYENELH